jgi:hypothetical protein
MAFFKLLLAFSPWLAFMVIAQGSMFRLQLGLGVALAISVVLGLTGVHRGVILWAGLLFFSFASLAVIGFKDVWTIRHMGVLANGMLASATWLTVVLRRPFTLDYARTHTDPSRWNDPVFLRTNYVLTSIWGVVFTINAVLAFGKMESFLLKSWEYEIINYSLLISVALFTVWYPNRVKSRLQRA